MEHLSIRRQIMNLAGQKHDSMPLAKRVYEQVCRYLDAGGTIDDLNALYEEFARTIVNDSDNDLYITG